MDTERDDRRPEPEQRTPPDPAPATTETASRRPAAPREGENPPPGLLTPAEGENPPPGHPVPAEGENPPPGHPVPADGEHRPSEPPAPDGERRTAGAGGKAKGDGGAGPRRPRRRRAFIAAALLLLLLPLLGAETALRLTYTGDPAPGTRTRHRDALWLGHAWVDGRKTDADVTALARRLEGTGIRDLYVHAGPLEHDGTLPKSAYSRAGWLIPALHRAAPGVRVQAWLGDKLASESPDGLHLDRAATRTAVVAATRRILATGFEGAHFDLEPLHSGDRDYLSLLDDLRALTHAHHALLSVAAHQIDPLPAFHSFWGATTGHPKWWSQAYFGQVARRVDQIAVMSYDTMQPLQSLYGGYVAQQTGLALEVTPETTDLLMGLPFYHENRFGHWAHAETVPAAVRGVRLGLSRTDADRTRFGVALYVDFAATEGDWSAYRKDWAQR
ncbi:hypothetical protein [Streptomyces sp. NPDC007905]|uniref:hypothetical protein n=1 Tax=Streptomyces sp. NPDC007905 TaxID=3364788 RepID=UPI0036E38447